MLAPPTQVPKAKSCRSETCWKPSRVYLLQPEKNDTLQTRLSEMLWRGPCLPVTSSDTLTLSPRATWRVLFLLFSGRSELGRVHARCFPCLEGLVPEVHPADSVPSLRSLRTRRLCRAAVSPFSVAREASPTPSHCGALRLSFPSNSSLSAIIFHVIILIFCLLLVEYKFHEAKEVICLVYCYALKQNMPGTW